MGFKGFFRKFSKTLGSGISGLAKTAGSIGMSLGSRLIERGAVQGLTRLAPSLGALLL